MGTTRVKAKKLHVPNFHLRIAAASKHNRSLSEVDGDEK